MDKQMAFIEKKVVIRFKIRKKKLGKNTRTQNCIYSMNNFMNDILNGH
jgi:hypothetical protein